MCTGHLFCQRQMHLCHSILCHRQLSPSIMPYSFRPIRCIFYVPASHSVASPSHSAWWCRFSDLRGAAALVLSAFLYLWRKLPVFVGTYADAPSVSAAACQAHAAAPPHRRSVAFGMGREVLRRELDRCLCGYRGNSEDVSLS